MIIEEINSITYFYSMLNQYGIFEGISINNFKDLILKNTLPNNIFFRGQNAIYSSIICGLSREKGFYKNEYYMYSETLTTKQDDFNNFHLPLEYLSKMQHYGMPTRLVDFTINPFIALFFAVQNEQTCDDAFVYVFKDCGIDIEDDKVKILSLLPTIKEKNIDALKNLIEEVFGYTMSVQDIMKIINDTYFINFTERLKESNVRLNHQEGTFAICGNIIKDGKITDQPCEVNIEKSYLKIRIPYQYKITIKNELDLYFRINDNYIYPELTAWSDYIREKYSRLEFDANGAFSIISIYDVSVPELKRVEIKMVLNKQMNDLNIKNCVRQMLSENVNKFDIVWFYVATNGENYNASNWIKKGQWIATNISEKFSQVPFSELDQDNIYWEDGVHYKSYEIFNSNNWFRDDKELFVLFHHSFETLYPIFHSFEYGFVILDYENFCEEVDKWAHLITEICKLIHIFGHSKDNDFDDYLLNYVDFFIAMSDITYWIKLSNSDQNCLDYRINKCFKTIRSAINKIQGGKEKWMFGLKVATIDFEDFSFNENIKEIINYRQSIPISKNALNVYFSLKYYMNSKFFYIKGETNLFNGAILNIILSLKFGEIFYQQNSTVKNNKFEFTVDRYKMIYDNYSILLSLLYPRKQPVVFIDKAGQEYENLGGDYISHQGIDSTITYKKYFSMKDINQML